MLTNRKAKRSTFWCSFFSIGVISPVVSYFGIHAMANTLQQTADKFMQYWIENPITSKTLVETIQTILNKISEEPISLSSPANNTLLFPTENHVTFMRENSATVIWNGTKILIPVAVALTLACMGCLPQFLDAIRDAKTKNKDGKKYKKLPTTNDADDTATVAVETAKIPGATTDTTDTTSKRATK